MKALAFDLDGTLAESSTPVSPAIADALERALAIYPIGIVTAAGFDAVERQLLTPMGDRSGLERLQILTNLGAGHSSYVGNGWRRHFQDTMSRTERSAIIAAAEQCLRDLDLWRPETGDAGPQIQDRGALVTISALGASADTSAKHRWDPSGDKKGEIQEVLQAALPEYSVTVGGSTSVDVTTKGRDKGAAVEWLCEFWGIEQPALCFVGDQLQPGGNDHAVTRLAVAIHPVSGPEECLAFLQDVVNRGKDA